MEMLVNTVRMVDYDQVKEYSFGDDDSLTKHLAIALLNPEDFKNLNLSTNSNLKISNNFGSVIVKPIQNKNVPLGIINLPVSIWANQITGIMNNELVYKNIKVIVEATEDSVIDIKDLLNSIKER
ncbi:MAG: molybdopterin dinucleotide binding domain-containing protein [Candidatus Hodarchaeota archaeon]